MVCCTPRRDQQHIRRGASGKSWGSHSTTRFSTSSGTGSTAASTSGTQIPSEHDLSRELAVSRVTLREALRELVRENLLVKVQGKGTFVTSNPPKRLARVRYTGFLEELQERVRKLRVTDVEVSQTPATSELRTALGLDAAVTELTLIKRLRHIDDEPFSYTLNYLPTEIGARIRIKDLYSLPLLKILQEDLKIPIVRAHETIEAAPADPDTARRLAIPVLYPVLHMTRTMYTPAIGPSSWWTSSIARTNTITRST